MYPPLQLTTDVWHTITPNRFHISKHVHIHMADGPYAIDHTSMLHHYNQEVSHIEECTYTHGTWTPLQLTICLCYTIAPNTFHI